MSDNILVKTFASTMKKTEKQMKSSDVKAS